MNGRLLRKPNQPLGPTEITWDGGPKLQYSGRASYPILQPGKPIVKNVCSTDASNGVKLYKIATIFDCRG
jgi:hypothetical protein